ncbi:MAG: heavy metal translocating P-type ATPase, partial [Bacilli bacterium]|nr:heavy metal translocating P-type ATPase [Bacilli bacterium]
KVERLFEDSAISKILELVTNSGERKSKAEKFITKFARFYTPMVLILALFIALVPLVFKSQAYADWIYNALSVIVVSCPCAIVISVPLAYFAGIGLASKNGILVKGSNYLDELNNLGYILTDKTGTLTHGYFEVKKAVFYEIEEELFWEYLVAVESQSNHPIAKAIIHDRKKLNTKVLQENYHEVPGAGVSSTYKGVHLIAGKPSFLKTAGVEVAKVKEKGTIIYLAVNQKYAGYVVLNDTAKYDSKHMVSQLKKMKIETVLLSGDHISNVEDIANEVGIEKYYGQLTPAEKLDILEQYLANNDKGVGFVGDGVNDAPSIIRSDVGFAMSGIGSDLAVENAEVIIVNDNPIKVVDAIKISKRTRLVALFNIIFSLLVKFSIVVLVLLDLLGQYQMTVAMIADTGLTVVMILNSLLILYYKV